MKKLLSIFLFIPLITSAQTEDTQPATPRNEVGFSTGGELSMYIGEPGGYLSITNGLRYYRNCDKWQAGVQVNYINHTWLHGYWDGYTSYMIAPSALLNRTFNKNKRTFYVGASAGYLYAFMKDGASDAGTFNGFSLGLQTGYTFHVGRHLSLNGEVSVASQNGWSIIHYNPLGIWMDEYWGGGSTEPYTLYDFHSMVATTATIGVRYRF